MQCNNPITLRGKGSADSDDLLVVPCGRCLGCKMARSREWAIRIIHEIDSWESNIFATFTYDDEHLPQNNSISVHELKKLWKRLRKNINRPIKYYACGEYGERKGRPHYHAIIFNLSLQEHGIYTEGKDKGVAYSGPLVDCWPFGQVHLGTVTFNSARYVSQYLEKKYYGIKAKKEFLDRGLEVPFQVVSQGLGLEYALKNKDQLVKDLGVRISGSLLALPRYYKKKLEIDKKEFERMAKQLKVDTNLRLFDKGIFDPEEVKKFLIQENQQKEANLTAKSKLYLRQKT